MQICAKSSPASRIRARRLGFRFRRERESAPRPSASQIRAQLRDLFQRRAQHLQIARVAAGLREAAHGALHVADGLQRLAELPSRNGSASRSTDHLLARAERREIAERMQNPVAQFARAHRRDGAVERAEQAGVAPAAARVHELEIRLRCGIDRP